MDLGPRIEPIFKNEAKLSGNCNGLDGSLLVTPLFRTLARGKWAFSAAD
jgi:hypothetical protein